MAKRRTKKDKERAKHSFTLSWTPASPAGGPEPTEKLPEATVKGQLKKASEARAQKAPKYELANLSGKDENVANAKRDMMRSLIIAGAIVGLEIVLYLAWNV